MSPEERRERGARARALLDDPLLSEAFQRAEQTYVAAWKAGRAAEDRERAHHCLVALEAVRAHLVSILFTGELARKEMRELEGGATNRLWRRKD